MGEKQFRAEYVKFALMELPSLEKLSKEKKQELEKIVSGARPPALRPGKVCVYGVEGGRVRIRFPFRSVKQTYIEHPVGGTWFFAEKEELAKYLGDGFRYDVFVPLGTVVEIPPPRGRPPEELKEKKVIRGQLVFKGQIVHKPKPKSEGKQKKRKKQPIYVKVPDKVVIVADDNPTGRFYGESVALLMRAKDKDPGEVLFATASQVQRGEEPKPFNMDDWSPGAKKHIARVLFDQAFNEVAAVIAGVVDELGIFPKKRAIIKRLRTLREKASAKDAAVIRQILERVEGGDVESALRLVENIENKETRKAVKRAVEMQFLLTDVGRVGFSLLALLDDLERERRVVVETPTGEVAIPVSHIKEGDVERVKVRLQVVPVEPSERLHFAVPHDEAVRWLVSCGLSTDDAEMVLERLWLRGYIPYARNSGEGFIKGDAERVAEVLGLYGLDFDVDRYRKGDPGLYPLGGWGDLTGVEREFMDWLARQVATRKVPAKISARVYVGRDIVDEREYEDVVPVDDVLDGTFEARRVERWDDGVPLSELVKAAQLLGIGTEATRSKILGALEDVGLVTVGEKIKLTHNGRIITTLFRAAFPYAGDYDRVKEVLDEYIRNAGDDVGGALEEAMRKLLVNRKDWIQFANDYLSDIAGIPKKKPGLLDRVVFFCYLWNRVTGGWPTLREVRRRYIRGGGLPEDTRRLLEESGYFEFEPGKRRDSILVVLTPKGLRRARQIEGLVKAGRHVTDVGEEDIRMYLERLKKRVGLSTGRV